MARRRVGPSRHRRGARPRRRRTCTAGHRRERGVDGVQRGRDQARMAEVGGVEGDAHGSAAPHEEPRRRGRARRAHRLAEAGGALGEGDDRVAHGVHEVDDGALRSHVPVSELPERACTASAEANQPGGVKPIGSKPALRSTRRGRTRRGAGTPPRRSPRTPRTPAPRPRSRPAATVRRRVPGGASTRAARPRRRARRARGATARARCRSGTTGPPRDRAPPGTWWGRPAAGAPSTSSASPTPSTARRRAPTR